MKALRGALRKNIMLKRSKKPKLIKEPKGGNAISQSRCPICNDFIPLPDKGKISKWGKEDFDFQDLKLDCAYCNLLRRMIVHYVPNVQSTRSPEFHLFLAGDGRAIVSVGDIVFGIHRKWEEMQSSAQIEPRLPVPPLNRLKAPSIAADSLECFDFIRAQLKDCLDNHHDCSSASTDSLLPRRVIAFDIEDYANTVRIRESDGQRARYVALSHCWGDREPLTTTSANLDKHKQCIPWHSLPRLFQDTIHICAELGAQYLWIDSLCILQDTDDQGDWQEEAVKMGEYYGNALLTINPLMSEDATVPILGERPSELLPTEFTLHLDPSTSLKVYGFRHVRKHEDELEPLLSRGWTFQEGLLASRALYYTSAQVVWRCVRRFTTESVYEEEKWAKPSRSLEKWLQLCPLQISEERAMNEWSKCIEHYSTRHLTYATDRLVAISGIASRFAPFIKSRYLAGHWESRFVESLCWESYDSERDFGVPPEYIAPSWAWPSISGGIDSNGRLLDSDRVLIYHATVLNAVCQVDGSNPYGRVKDGYLLMRGRLITLAVKTLKTTTHVWDCHLHVVNGIIVRALSVDGDSHSCDKKGCLSAADKRVCTVSCLLLLEDELRFRNGESSNYYYFLLLSKQESGNYIRIGIIITDETDDMEWFTTAKEETVKIV